MDRSDWLNSLKPGDEVAITRRLSRPVIATVDRATATQIIVGGVRFSREDGRKRGGSTTVWNGGRPELNPVTDQIRDAVEREVYIVRLYGVERVWPKLTTGQLRRVVAIVEEKNDPS